MFAGWINHLQNLTETCGAIAAARLRRDKCSHQYRGCTSAGVGGRPEEASLAAIRRGDALIKVGEMHM